MLKRSLSKGFGQLGSLKELSLYACISLEALPAGIPALPSPLYFCVRFLHFC